MTEEQWLAAAEPWPLVRAGGAWTERRLRLLAVGCYRDGWGRSPIAEARHAIDVIEGFADGTATAADVAAVGVDAGRAWAGVPDRGTRADPAWARRQRQLAAALNELVASCPTGPAPDDLRRAINRVLIRLGGLGLDGINRRFAQAALVRDIAGNPFRPVAFMPEWRTSTVAGLAGAIYAGRAFADLPILADALEDAGCDAAELLAHCRDTTLTHVRGCWALDLVLGRA